MSEMTREGGKDTWLPTGATISRRWLILFVVMLGFRSYTHVGHSLDLISYAVQWSTGWIVGTLLVDHWRHQRTLSRNLSKAR